MADKIYNLTQEEANTIVAKCVGSQKYRITEQNLNKIILKENTFGDLFMHLVIFGITFWSYGIFNLVYAIVSGEVITINIKESASFLKFKIGGEEFAEITLNDKTPNRYVYSPYINHNNIDDKNIVWIEEGRPVEIAGLTIDGGMIYISSQTSGVQGAISTNLPVSEKNIQPRTKHLDYWPSYTTASPEARKAYLKWLAGGRKDPEADIGYVFLFFYGLEWRFFKHILKKQKDWDESQLIVEELERLLQIYSDKSSSFRSYATNLLEYINLKSGDKKFNVDNYISLKDRTYWEIPFPLKYELGKYAYKREPLYPKLALAWTKHAVWSLRTPAHRCENLFNEQFIKFYKKQYEKGMVINTSSKKLSINYHAASNQIRENLTLTFDGVADISQLERPLISLRGIADKATDELDLYSRFLGKHPDRKEEACLYLPSDVRGAEFMDGIDKVKKKIGMELVTIPLSDILSVFGISANISAKSVGLFVEMLSDESIAFIPSKPIDKKIDFSMKVTLLLSQKKIKINEEEIAYPRIVVYAISQILAGITTVSDNDINGIVSTLTKSVSNRIYLKTIFGQDIKPAELKTHIQKIDKNKKDAFLKDVASKVSNIIAITPNIIKKIEKIGTMSSIDTKELHSIIHNVHTKTENKINGKLDFDRIKKLKKSSKEISDILNEVFTDEENTVQQSKAKKSKKSTTCVLNLTGKKEEFFNVLISKDGWDKNDLSKIARDKGLMFEGILEEINEQAFEVFDDTLIELDDKIYVNLELLEA